MTDTSEEIKQLQLAIWLAKSPEERLRQFMIDNEAMYRFWNNTIPKGNPAPPIVFDEPNTNHH